jgi:hypothetical protein
MQTADWLIGNCSIANWFTADCLLLIRSILDCRVLIEIAHQPGDNSTIRQ